MNTESSQTKAKHLRPRAVAASVAALCALSAAVPAVSGAAGKRDRDRDGLSNRAERRIGTSPKRADTDRDRLKDGREVRLGSNPLRADTDGDGTPDGQEVRDGSDPRIDESEVEGTLTAIGDSSVTISGRDGVETVVAVDASTELRAPDRDESGDVTLADFQVGDRVEAHLNADGTVATELKVEGNEVKGLLTAIGENSVTITGRDGVATDVGIDANTEFRAPSRERDGEVTLADFQIGDRVKAELSPDGSVATELKRLPAKAQGHGRGKGQGRGEGHGRGQGRGHGED